MCIAQKITKFRLVNTPITSHSYHFVGVYVVGTFKISLSDFQYTLQYCILYKGYNTVFFIKIRKQRLERVAYQGPNICKWWGQDLELGPNLMYF